MSEHLRAFVVITILMAVAYVISKRLFAHALEPKFVERLYGTGYAATAVMFLAHNMWIFLAGLAGLSLLAVRRFSHPLALFVFLLLLMPGFTAQVPGFGLINYLIDLNPWRILALTLLLPAAATLLHNRALPRPGKLFADKLVIAFTLYTTLLAYVQYQTFTGGLRHLANMSLDFVLIYYVASRGLLLKGAVRQVLVAVVMAAIFLALVGAFEFLKHWLLYSSVPEALGAGTGLYGYLARGNTLRASATTGQPIALGFVMMVAFLLSHYVQRLVPLQGGRILLWGVMGMGLIAAMSRGPWVGAAIGMFVIAVASAKPFDNVFKLALASFCAAVGLFLLPGGEKILDYLPWVGRIDAGGIDFREILWDQSMLVISKNPWLGSIGFTELPEFDVIRLGTGFVDIVNTYLGIALSYGLIGLVLYGMLIIAPTLSIIRAMTVARFYLSETSISAKSMLGILVALIAAIWMVSSISHIGPLVTFLLGASVALSKIIQPTK